MSAVDQQEKQLVHAEQAVAAVLDDLLDSPAVRDGQGGPAVAALGRLAERVAEAKSSVSAPKALYSPYKRKIDARLAVDRSRRNAPFTSASAGQV